MRRIGKIAAIAALSFAYTAPARAQSLPNRLSDDEFWRLIGDLSEAGGYFRSDNFVSNETTFQYVVPELQKSHASGGVYLGVGPDQNFTYIVALKPRMAFITDIRRQNMLEHLMYKAVIELSPTRADFVALLFSRPKPAGLSDTTGAPGLMQAFLAAPSDSVLYRKNLATIKDQLVTRHRFALTADDLSSITYVYDAFFNAGPDLTYSFASGRQGRAGYFGRRMPSYAELMTESDALGMHRSYLATEDNYRTLRDLEVSNLIVPIVGDFAGDMALKAVGAYLKQHSATVTALSLPAGGRLEAILCQCGDAAARRKERFYSCRVQLHGIPRSLVRHSGSALDDDALADPRRAQGRRRRKDPDVLRRHPTLDCSGSPT